MVTVCLMNNVNKMTALLCFARPLILLVVSSEAQSLINDRKLVMSLGHKAAVTHRAPGQRHQRWQPGDDKNCIEAESREFCLVVRFNQLISEWRVCEGPSLADTSAENRNLTGLENSQCNRY